MYFAMIPRWGIGLFFACAISSPASSGPPPAREWAERIYPLVEDGHYDAALRAAEAAVRHYPEDPELLYLLGSVKQVSGDPAEAVIALTESYRIEAAPSTAQRLANLLVSSNRSRDAIPLLESELAVRPDNPRLQGDLARLYRLEFSFDNAIAHIRKSIELDPGNDLEWCELLDMLIYLGKISEASEEVFQCERALGSGPIVAYWKGRLELSRGNVREAGELMQRAVEQIPNVSAVWLMYCGQALANAGRLEEARQILEKAVAARPDLQGAYYQLANVYRRTRELAAARQALLIHQLLRGDKTEGWQSIAESHRAYPFIRERLAIEALQDGDLAGAIGHATAVVAANPNRVQAVMTLAKAYREIGDATNALDAAWIAERQIGGDPEFQSFVAGLLESQGRLEESGQRRELGRKLREAYFQRDSYGNHTPFPTPQPQVRSR